MKLLAEIKNFDDAFKVSILFVEAGGFKTMSLLEQQKPIALKMASSPGGGGGGRSVYQRSTSTCSSPNRKLPGSGVNPNRLGSPQLGRKKPLGITEVHYCQEQCWEKCVSSV
jgi:hypothetical protein